MAGSDDDARRPKGLLDEAEKLERVRRERQLAKRSEPKADVEDDEGLDLDDVWD